VLGEILQCSVDYPDGACTLIAEQVSHHPPVSAFAITCPSRHLEITCSQGFTDSNVLDSLTDHRDTAVTAAGNIVITFKGSEVYQCEQGMPKLMLHGSPLSETIAYYSGEVRIECPETHYSSILTFDRQDSVNHWTGHIMHKGEAVGLVEGTCGSVSTISLRGERSILFDARAHPATIRWLPLDWDALHSLNVWREANAAIVSGDFSAANTAKSHVEDQQRKRAAQHHYTPRFFVYDPRTKVWRPISR